MVMYLVECGANLLIMNRNGNTPSGLASSKGYLDPETCALIERVSSKQLQAGGSYQHHNTDKSTSKNCDPDNIVATKFPFGEPNYNLERTADEKAQETRMILFGKTEDQRPSLKSLSKMLRDAGKYVAKLGVHSSCCY